jgi:hypothetical protein
MSHYESKWVNELSLHQILPRHAGATPTGDGSTLPGASGAVAELHDLVCIGRYMDAQCETEELVCLGGFNFVLDRMQSFPLDPSIQALCCALLINFLRLEADDTNLPNSTTPTYPPPMEIRVRRVVKVPSEWLCAVERDLIERGLGHALLHAIEEHPTNGQIQVLGSVLLQRFAHCILLKGSEHESEVGTALKVANTLLRRTVAGGFPGLVTITEWRSRIIQTIEFLQVLVAYGYDLEEVLVGSGLMLRLAGLCSGSSRSQLQYLELVFTILEEIPSTCRHLLSLVPVVIRIMKSRIRDKVLVATGCGILLLMAHESEGGKSTIVLHGGVHCMVRVLLCNTSSLACAMLSAGVLHSLAAASNQDVRRQLQRTSPILWDTLLAAHRLHASCFELTAHIASIFDLALPTPSEGAEES